MAIKIGQEFERTSKATRFKDDVMTKAQMLACTDDNYSDGYLVVEKDSHDLYIYDSNATPSAETGKFVKKGPEGNSLPAGGTTGQVLAKKSNADQDVEWADQTVIVGSDWGVAKQGAVSVSSGSPATVSLADTSITSASDYQVVTQSQSSRGSDSWVRKEATSFEIRTSETNTANIYYTVFAKGYGGVPNGGTTGQALVKKSDTDGDVERKTVGGAIPDNIVTARATLGAGNVDIYSMTGTSNEYTPVEDKVTMDLRVIQGGTYSDLPQFNISTAGAGNPIYSKHLATTDYVDTQLDDKQDTLVSGTNIKTVNNQSLLGSGDIPIPTIVGSDWGVAKAGVIPSVGTSATVSIDISELGLSSVNDYTVNLDIINGGEIYPASTLRIASRTATSFGIRNTSSTNVYGAVYTVFAKGCGSVPNGGTTGQALVKKSNTDGDVEWKTVSGGGASLTIDTTDPNYGEATISEGGQNLSFTNQNGQGVHIGGISENGEMVASKSYVDSKSPTIVNEGATFTNAAGNQKMQIRTGGTNSVIIKDTNANGTTEYWSYELPDKPYVDTEVAKRNAVVNFDNEYKTLQIRDVDNKLDFQVVKETSNDYVRMNEYAKDDRGQMQQIFDVKLPTKEYVDSKGGGVNMEVGAEKWYGTYTEDGVTYQVYSKIVYIPALPSTAGITTYPMGVSNIKQILNIYGYTTDGFILNAPRQNVQDNISIYQVSKGSQTFSIEVGKDRSSKKAYVTIIYAKNNT